MCSPSADPQALTLRVDLAAANLHTQLPPTTRDQLVHWISLILTWNKKIDLTAARTADELVDLCLADAFVLCRRIANQAHVVDVGSGAGAPGLPLALLRPDLSVTLVEPLAKRVSFLRTAIGTLSVRVRVERLRGEALVGGGKWDVAVSRATLDPHAWLQLGSSLVKPTSGRVAVLLARQPAPACENVVMREDDIYIWPLTQSERRIVWYERATPAAECSPESK